MSAPIVVSEHVFVPATAVRMTASRASGPGGQNVNKVASKVDVRVDLAQVVGLDDASRARLLAKAEPRLDADGLLQVVSQKTRDQAKNLADAFEKVRVLIAAAMIAPVPRRPTRPSRGAVRARLKDKKHTSARKRSRSSGPEE